MTRLGWSFGAALAFLSACGNGSVAPHESRNADASMGGDSGGGGSEAGIPRPPLRDAGLLTEAKPCNTEPKYCAVTFDRMVFPTSHAAGANEAPPFSCTAQDKSVRTQLDEGIRALNLQVFETSAAHGTPATDLDAGRRRDAGDARARSTTPLQTCFGDCSEGSLPFSGTLADVKAFFDVNPREVVSLLIEGGVEGEHLADELREAGLDALAWTQKKDAAWPTLGAMVEAGRRLVVFADVTGSPPAWMLPLWSFVGATGTHFTSLQAMTCDVTQGDSNAPLYWINDTLVSAEGGEGCGSVALATTAGAEPGFQNRLGVCVLKQKKPTFIAADFYEDGDVRDLARSLSLGP